MNSKVCNVYAVIIRTGPFTSLEQLKVIIFKRYFYKPSWYEECVELVNGVLQNRGNILTKTKFKNVFEGWHNVLIIKKNLQFPLFFNEAWLQKNSFDIWFLLSSSPTEPLSIHSTYGAFSRSIFAMSEKPNSALMDRQYIFCTSKVLLGSYNFKGWGHSRSNESFRRLPLGFVQLCEVTATFSCDSLLYFVFKQS